MDVQDLPSFGTLPISKEGNSVMLDKAISRFFFLLSVRPENQNLPTYSIKKWYRKKNEAIFNKFILFSINKKSFEYLNKDTKITINSA